MNNTDAHLFFHYCPSIGPKRFSLIKRAFGNPLHAWQASKSEWLKIGFPSKLVEVVFEHKQQFDLEEIKQNLARYGIHYLAQDDRSFPRLLTEIADCPIGLFTKGTILFQDTKSVAVVGTRKVTPYGREVTQRFVSALVGRGFTIVSGLARGVDGIAHKAALEAGGRTIAVLGCGLDEVYPPEHRVLANEITSHGAVISELPPGAKISPGNFPARNRIISGVSLGVLVTEGSIQSGTNITAMMAVDQNREVFAIPGPITSTMSQGPAKLIQMGAKLAISVDDILSELQISNADTNLKTNTIKNGNGHMAVSNPNFDDKEQEQIWQHLLNGNQHIDDIGRELKVAIPQVMTALTLLEIRGLVKNLGEGIWMVN